MSDSISDAEKVRYVQCDKQRANRLKIRNKRLAKLGSQAAVPADTNKDGNSKSAAASSPSKSPDFQSGEYAQSKEQPALGKAALASLGISKSPENPFSQLASRSSSGEGPAINITRAGGMPVTPMKRSSPTTERPSSRAEESLQEWEDRILGNIFRLSLNADATADSHGHHLDYVKGVREDLEEQGGAVRLSTGVLDQAILEAASKVGKRAPLDYLLECWKRVSRQFKSFRGERVLDPKYDIIKEARRLCMSYCIFAVTMPDMFG